MLIVMQCMMGCEARDCQLLLQPGLSDDQKLDIILNFAQYNPAATYHFPSKVCRIWKESFISVSLFTVVSLAWIFC